MMRYHVAALLLLGFFGSGRALLGPARMVRGHRRHVILNGKGFGTQTPQNSPEKKKKRVESSPPTFPTGPSGPALDLSFTEQPATMGERQSEILEKYGITGKEARDPVAESSDLESKIEGVLDPLALVPAEVQQGIEKFLIFGLVVSIVLFVLAGIAIAAEAFSVATQNAFIPPDIDKFIVDVVEPYFTPGGAVFFAFSISLGVFKSAQLSRTDISYSEADFQYTEPDE